SQFPRSERQAHHLCPAEDSSVVGARFQILGRAPGVYTCRREVQMVARLLASWGARAFALAVLCSTVVTVAGQTPSPTSHGKPDFQGIWISRSATPLERPKALAGRPLLTDAEVAE